MSAASAPDFKLDRGTAARSGAGDLALFAAVPIAFSSVPAEADPAHFAVGRAGSTAAAHHDGDTSHDDGNVGQGVAHLVASPAQPHSAPVPSRSAEHLVSSGGDAPSETPHPIAHGSGIATYVPASHHAFAPPASHHTAIASPSEAVDHAAVPAAAGAAVLAPEVAQALSAITATAHSLSGAVAALNDHLAGTSDGVGQAVSDTLGEAQAVVDSALGHVGDLGAMVASTVTPIVADVGDTTDALLSTTGTVLDDAGSAASAVLGHAGDTVDTVVQQAADTAGTIADAAGSTVDTAVGQAVDTTVHLTDGLTSTLTDTAAGASDGLLDDLGGSNPAGGISTLVGMVSAADMFAIHDNGPSGDVGLTPALGIDGAIDMLADDLPTDVLLGATDHHDGLLGGVLHDDAGHLLGLG